MSFDSSGFPIGSATEAGRRTHPGREEATPSYSAAELAEGWEFKVIRSQLGLFARREFFERILAEEGRAGWALIEKFDDRAIRMTRRRKLHPEPEFDDYDPYRIIVDAPERASQAWSEGWLSLLAIVLVPLVVVLIISAFR